MDKLRKSFKSLSPDNTKNTSSQSEEEHQVLLNQTEKEEKTNFTMTSSSPAMDTSDAMDVIVKINTRETPKGLKDTELSSSSKSQFSKNGGSTNSKTWRDSSYDFTNDDVMKEQWSSNKDFDFVTESPLSRVNEESPNNGGGVLTPRDVKVSFNDHLNETKRRRSNASDGEAGVQDEVLLCSSSTSSFRSKSSLLKTKTKSRLMDPPEQDHKSQKMTMKSGFLGKGSEIDEEDPFWDEDLPEQYKKMKFSTLSVLQLVSLILIIAALVCSLTIRVLREKRVFELELWKWELMVLVLISGRLVSGWFIRIAVYFIERNFLWRKRVLYFVYGLRNAVQNCIWLSFVLIAWQSIFDKKVERVTHGKVLPYVSRVWVCLLVGTFIWLLKTLLVKVLAMSFHVTAFFDRIQESLFNQYVIETLSGPPFVEIENEQEEDEKVMAEVQKLQNAGATLPADLKAAILQKRPIGTARTSPTSAIARSPVFSRVMSKKEKEEEGGITIDHLHRLNQKNISAWNMKRLTNIVRKGVLSTLHDQLQESTDEGESVEITSEKLAKVAARKIFNNVAKPGSKFIYLEDFMRFMREDEALKTIRLFEGGTEAKGVSKRALKTWVVNAFRERRALALSLNDTKTAVKKLHQMLNVLVAVIIVVIWLLILRVANTHFLVLMSSQVLLVVFMFGNSAKTTFEAIIFLFVMHPFDVGDRLEVEGVQMIVEEMNILTTVFLRYDNQKIIYPNSVLSMKPISNYYRSPHMGDAIDFCIHISTPMDKIAAMKEKITRFVDNKSDHWYPAPLIVMRDVEDLNRIKWSVWLSHTMNHQDMGERWSRRALLVEEMIRIFRELDIEYRMLPLDVNVRNLPPLSSSRVPSNWTICA
ncbi:mechanosensitive ion channel protein 6-like [Nicotiana tomentosiformis]|uniref:mechanosensitive ion channel protein 6-like n=1 Tax=Nicotiana tomentosiformis TaxID=4098 RepID=UPI00051C1083|nr:mechanosensitive ion channel protein 6-like [Nicotiana tomentosiformis]XP_033508447.1 mechanosensitive ion channel protein 6-like [Nicotiana tomentosiformis]